MARYSLAIGLQAPRGAVATTAPICSLRAANANRDARLFEMGVFVATAQTADVQFGRPATAGTATTSVGPQASGFGLDNVAGAGNVVVDTVWTTTPPTAIAATNVWRRAFLPATIGAGVIWTFPEGIVVPANGGSVCLWQNTAGAATQTYNVYFDFDE
jgi:hypothetical protein